ncbi:MipA/OmpV family protein [Blastomonas sp. UPD001]|jgi:MipA family protein|uniref:MipA/OmpV family protein n=1 Tax=Blastomonas sp. UPD001 TaxID=2217673 RepID=UPI000E347BDF|nr:MipA/OmpV family protein [Blastomonas sp. UPD001]MBL0965503.1 MipA/OmpV family protein [Blastomonas sp.]
MIARTLASLALFASASTPALAQAVVDQPPAPESTKADDSAPAKPGPTPEQLRLLATAAAMSQSVFAKDFYMTVGLGAGMVPSYEGSNQYVFFPAPIIQGSYKGYNFAARGPGLFVDLVKDPVLPKVEYIAGPMFRVRLERNNRIRDAVVQRLGDKPIALELGASGGVKINRIFNRFDSVTFSADALFDVTGVHSGALITPQVSYNRLLGTQGVVNISASADFVDGDYADTYFSVDAAGSAASGLPRFRADGGLKSIGTTALVGLDLSGNALDGGWGVFALGSYSRLQGDFADSPIVAIRGDADQFFGGVGVTYTF